MNPLWDKVDARLSLCHLYVANILLLETIYLYSLLCIALSYATMPPTPEISHYALLPMPKALEIIASTLSALPAIIKPITQALQHITSRPVYALYPQPPFRASIKDGYAVTLPLSPTLTVVSSSHAGNASPIPITTGQAAYVTTGAPVPEGTQAVIMVENCICNAHVLTFVKQLSPTIGQDIREIGCDVASGQLVLDSGTYLGAAEIAILASCRITTVQIFQRPIIGVLSSGDELLDITNLPETIPYGSIVDSNRPMLLAAIQETLPFCTSLDLGCVPDNESSVRDQLLSAIQKCHIVITTGGVSMGHRDFIKPMLEKIALVHFGRVLMKPGKPLTYATISNQRCFLALPGNPVSSFVCFHLAVAVAARKLAGWNTDNIMGLRVDVSLAHDIKLDKERPEYHRAILQVL